MIHIEPIELPTLPKADWFFFYSKNAVECFARQWKEKWSHTISTEHILWGAMGPGTAESMAGWGIHSDFVGHGEAAEIAEQFLAHIKPSESVLFFRAYHSRNELFRRISGHRESVSIPIYDNQLVSKQFPAVDIGIFTSSRNAVGFLEHNAIPTQASIAIGQPTSDTLISLGVPADKIYTAAEPTEEALLETLQKLFEK